MMNTRTATQQAYADAVAKYGAARDAGASSEEINALYAEVAETWNAVLAADEAPKDPRPQPRRGRLSRKW